MSGLRISGYRNSSGCLLCSLEMFKRVLCTPRGGEGGQQVQPPLDFHGGEEDMRKTDELADPNGCLNRAYDDEMLFVLLGRDRAAAETIKFWCGERLRLGLNNPGDQQLVDAVVCAEACIQPGDEG